MPPIKCLKCAIKAIKCHYCISKLETCGPAVASKGRSTEHPAPMVARYRQKTSIGLGARKFVLYERSNTKLKYLCYPY